MNIIFISWKLESDIRGNCFFSAVNKHGRWDDVDSAFLVHVGAWQLPRKMPTYIEKKHYHGGKKVADVGFVSTQILDFNPLIFRLEHLSLVESTVKHIHFQGHRQDINACITYLYFFFFFFVADFNSLDITFVERTCYLFLLIKIYS